MVGAAAVATWPQSRALLRSTGVEFAARAPARNDAATLQPMGQGLSSAASSPKR